MAVNVSDEPTGRRLTIGPRHDWVLTFWKRVRVETCSTATARVGSYWLANTVRTLQR